MKPPIWLETKLIYAIHGHQLSEHSGRDGILDTNLILSALMRPVNLYSYGSPDIADLAAAYVYSIIKNHGFCDGNKRTGWVASRIPIKKWI